MRSRSPIGRSSTNCWPAPASTTNGTRAARNTSFHHGRHSLASQAMSRRYRGLLQRRQPPLGVRRRIQKSRRPRHSSIGSRPRRKTGESCRSWPIRATYLLRHGSYDAFDRPCIDLDELFLRQLLDAASGHGISDWGVVLAADADDRTSVGWRNLMRLVGLAIPAVEQRSPVAPAPCSSSIGLLARYGQLGLFDRLARGSWPASPLRPAGPSSPRTPNRPAVDGRGPGHDTQRVGTRPAVAQNLHRAPGPHDRSHRTPGHPQARRHALRGIDPSAYRRDAEIAAHLELEHHRAGSPSGPRCRWRSGGPARSPRRPSPGCWRASSCASSRTTV